MSDEGYLLDNRATEAEDRFAALSALFDPVTFRHVEALGIAPGWRCWEVGAGGPSVPDGLATRVGPGGRVVATDLDTGWLAGRAGPHVEVATHDVVHDDPSGNGFDLVRAPDVDRYLELTRTTGFDLATAPLVSAWGQRPQT